MYLSAVKFTLTVLIFAAMHAAFVEDMSVCEEGSPLRLSPSEAGGN
jgi:hypothetical protein